MRRRANLYRIAVRPRDRAANDHVLNDIAGVVRLYAKRIVAAVYVAILDDRILRLDVETVVVAVGAAVYLNTPCGDTVAPLEHDAPARRVTKNEVLQINVATVREEKSARTQALLAAHCVESAALGIPRRPVAKNLAFARHGHVGRPYRRDDGAPCSFGVRQHAIAVVLDSYRAFQNGIPLKMQSHITLEFKLAD